MVTAETIIRYVEGLSGHPLNADEGVHHRTPEGTVSGVTVCWMATPAAIAAAGQSGDDLLLTHESLYFPYDVVIVKNPPVDWKEWRTNRQRRELLDKYKLSCLRVHGSLDEICIFDDFAALLGLGQPVYANQLVKVYEIETCSLESLVGLVKRKTHMAALRVSPVQDMEQMVRRVGLPWGGLGLYSNVAYQQRLIEQACDVLIAGESDNYGFRFSKECGIPMIETSHELSELPGLRHFVTVLGKAFPDLHVHLFEETCAWEMH